VIIGSGPTSQNTLSEYKNKLIKELVVRYLGSERRAGSKIYTHPDARRTKKYYKNPNLRALKNIFIMLNYCEALMKLLASYFLYMDF
jgi:hypothetical protein